MKKSIERAVTLLLFFSVSRGDANVKSKTPRTHEKTFGKYPSGGLISFNSEESQIRIDWDVSIPFLTIPLERNIGENGEIPSLLSVNTKGIGIIGLVTTLFTAILPLFSKSLRPQYNYRSEDNEQWFQMGNNINEVIFGNNYVASCMQRVVCSIVSVATHTENPTSTDKIIDGLSSHKWFRNVTNDTIIQEAVATGRKGDHDCAHIYKDCAITPKLLKSMMNEFGLV